MPFSKLKLPVRKSSWILRTVRWAILGAVVSTGVLSVLNAAMEPRIGDIYALPANGGWAARMAEARLGGGSPAAALLEARKREHGLAPAGESCVLDLVTMEKKGGSFFVTAVSRWDKVVLSWAGGPTSEAGMDCGSASSVEVDYRAFMRLGLVRMPVPSSGARKSQQ